MPHYILHALKFLDVLLVSIDGLVQRFDIINLALKKPTSRSLVVSGQCRVP
jgi:hypothetical protein